MENYARRAVEQSTAELRAERDADRRREYGYSQETVDAITRERDALRAELATLRAQNYETQSLLAGAEAYCDALRADAERWRWLRDPANAYRDEWNYFGPYKAREVK